MKLRSTVSAILIILVLSQNVHGQSSPALKDYAPAALGFGVAAGLELFGKTLFIPDQPRFSQPNAFDQNMRERLFWGTGNQHTAIKWSDRLLYGLSFSSLVWGPVLDKKPERAAFVNFEVLTANALATNIVKILSARERPYHHYGTLGSRGADDYASFFSGHTSVAFSQAVANAMMLSKSYPEQETLIWASLLGTAGLTGYLRVAGDMHYLSDVLVGALAGSTIAWLITSYEMDRFAAEGQGSSDFMFTLKIPLGQGF